MVQTEIPEKQNIPVPPEQKEPGLMDYYGSFPVWLLKIIDLLTPSIFKKPAPPKEPKNRP
jgi:hypothetical protein